MIERKCKIMKRKFVLGVIVFLVITNIICLGTTVLYKTKIVKQEFKVYSFQGEDEDLRISNGFVMISPNRQMLSGGDIQYKGKKLENIQIYSKTIYLQKEGYKDVVLSNSVSLTGDTKGMVFPDTLSLNRRVGEISSEKLFGVDDLDIIKDILYFSLDYAQVNGQKGNFTIKLKVKEFSMNEGE